MSMSMTKSTSVLEYGYVIKFVSSNPLYEGKYFFVDRLYDDKLIVLSDKETITLGITDETLDDKTMRIICKNLRLSYPLIRSIVRPFIEERELRALLEQQQLDELDKLDEIKNNDSEEEW